MIFKSIGTILASVTTGIAASSKVVSDLALSASELSDIAFAEAHKAKNESLSEAGLSQDDLHQAKIKSLKQAQELNDLFRQTKSKAEPNQP